MEIVARRQIIVTHTHLSVSTLQIVKPVTVSLHAVGNLGHTFVNIVRGFSGSSSEMCI